MSSKNEFLHLFLDSGNLLAFTGGYFEPQMKNLTNNVKTFSKKCSTYSVVTEFDGFNFCVFFHAEGLLHFCLSQSFFYFTVKHL